jgi:diadenosine tetraphosphate (Ap4A) HIT family hydrolase
MTSDLERALNERRAPWTEIEYRTRDFWVFRDAYAVTEGHLLFVPTQEKFDNIMECYRAAYKFGYDGVASEKWDGFNVGQNCGEAAGQTVMYPHIHMIPRRKGDMEDPRGGVRHVIPEKGNYKKEKQNAG